MTAGIDRTDGGLTVTTSASEHGLISTLLSLREQGRFEEAAALVRTADANRPAATMSAPAHLAAGPALAAVSDHAAAAVHLLLASTDPALAPEALGRLAELAWIEHDHPRGRAFALAGLALDPSDHRCRIQLHRNENGDRPRPDTGPSTAHRTLAHVARYADPQGNAGDRVLTDAVRRSLAGVGGVAGPGAGVEWHDLHVHQVLDEERLARVNSTDGLIVGGGGLFRADVAPNGTSGWQWNVTDGMLARITVPLVVFAAGHDLLDGPAAEEGERFARSLRTLVERSAFVGLRSHGSVERVRDLLPAELAERVGWQPCPTMITGLLPDPVLVPSQPDAADGDRDRAGEGDRGGPVLLNCAFDRPERRYQDGYGTFLGELRTWVTRTRERADVVYAAHCVDDERFVVDLRREHGLTLPVIAMYDLEPRQILAHYRRARLAVGMRRNAGTIPFGCGTPIIGLVPHPGPGHFLADIEREEWGVGVGDPHLAGRLTELTTRLLDDEASVRADIAGVRERLAGVTARNLASLPPSLHPQPPVRQDQPSE